MKDMRGVQGGKEVGWRASEHVLHIFRRCFGGGGRERERESNQQRAEEEASMSNVAAFMAAWKSQRVVRMVEEPDSGR